MIITLQYSYKQAAMQCQCNRKENSQTATDTETMST
jgi:hypothetical protein